MKLDIAGLLGAALLCGSLAVSAQAPSGDAGKGPGMMAPGGGHRMMKPCKDEADPAKCAARRKEMREHMKQAHESCKSSADKRGCMMQQICAKAPDPAKCQANAKERQQKHMQRMDEHQKAAEACTGKRGDELMKCMHDQRPRRKPDTR